MPDTSSSRYHSSSVGRRIGRPRGLGLPVAEGLGLELVHLDGPVPGHGDFLGQAAQPEITLAVRDPEQGVFGLAVVAPVPAFGGPPAFGAVAAGVHEFPELAVAHQEAGGPESEATSRFQVAVLVVPAVEVVVAGPCPGRPGRRPRPAVRWPAPARRPDRPASRGWGFTMSRGSWRISTELVSRWIRSCSMPIRMTQKGSSQVIGQVQGQVVDHLFDHRAHLVAGTAQTSATGGQS